MRAINLTSYQLQMWLSQRGLELNNDYWEEIKLECCDELVSERTLMIVDVPWRGAMKMVFAFINSSKLKDTGWLLPTIKKQNENNLFVAAVAFYAVTDKASRIHRPTKWFTPHVGTPEYSIKIEYPTLHELDDAWDTLSAIAPKICMVTESLSLEFETQLTRLSFTKT